ncbi:MAG: T9SS type A sorting domain-containing protein [Flavobacteriales bacterium]
MNIATFRWGVGAALSTLLATAVQAQILTQPNLPDYGFTLTYGVTNVQPEGFDWSTAFSIQTVNFDFIPTDSTAYADGFNSSDFATQVPAPSGGVNLSYFGYNENGMDFWGGVDATGVQVVHPEPLRFVPYPLGAGDVHGDTLAFEFSASGLNVLRQMSVHMEALAGGTMLLPGELSFENTLQVAQTQYVVDSTVASNGGLLIEGIAYWTQDMPVPIAQTYTYTQVVDGDSTELFVGAEFLVNATAGFELPQASSLAAFPSPASSSLTVSGEAGSWVRVLDVQGREVIRRQLVSDKETWDVSGWPAGMHFLNVEGTRRTVRVLLTH